MKKNFLKWYMVAFLLVSNFVVFAQAGDTVCPTCPPVEDDGSGDTTGFPINTKLVWLAIVGISFAFYYFNKRKEQKSI